MYSHNMSPQSKKPKNGFEGELWALPSMGRCTQKHCATWRRTCLVQVVLVILCPCSDLSMFGPSFVGDLFGTSFVGCVMYQRWFVCCCRRLDDIHECCFRFMTGFTGNSGFQTFGVYTQQFLQITVWMAKPCRANLFVCGIAPRLAAVSEPFLSKLAAITVRSGNNKHQ